MQHYMAVAIGRDRSQFIDKFRIGCRVAGAGHKWVHEIGACPSAEVIMKLVRGGVSLFVWAVRGRRRQQTRNGQSLQL